ncbi:MAG: hypothetical protein JWO65_2614 [Sphingomonas bacterium]|jgi:hypothetical protein|nr:hypothetical protein [Sphingomonas bacterium]
MEKHDALFEYALVAVLIVVVVTYGIRLFGLA